MLTTHRAEKNKNIVRGKRFRQTTKKTKKKKKKKTM